MLWVVEEQKTKKE